MCVVMCFVDLDLVVVQEVVHGTAVAGPEAIQDLAAGPDRDRALANGAVVGLVRPTRIPVQGLDLEVAPANRKRTAIRATKIKSPREGLANKGNHYDLCYLSFFVEI